jgi:hypothetical protein
MRSIAKRGVSVALLVAFVLWTGAGAADKEKLPSILIEEMRHDLGKVYEKELFKHSFEVKNAGDADLEIKNVKPG